MTTNTMTPTVANIPQTKENMQLSSPQKTDSSKSAVIQTNQKDKKPAKVAWWKFWAKKPAKDTTVLQKSNVQSSTSDFQTPVRRDALKTSETNTSGRGGLNGLASSNDPVTTERLAEDPMLGMFRDLKTSNAELNRTLKEISAHLKISNASDARVIESLNRVDQSITQADRTFVESSSAIVASAERSDQSILTLNEHITDSSKSFQEVTKRIESNDLENRNNIDKLQKRSNAIILGLGVAMTVAAITFSLLQLLMG